MHVVSAITHEDLPPTSPTKGPEVLRRFLAMAAAGGRPRDVGRAIEIMLNPLEERVLAELTRRGIPATPQWGVAGYRIDFALADPERQGRMVLALEVDGDSYHRLASARDRDRLRQSHLEKMGWEFHRVWASAWFSDPDGQADGIERHWKDVLAAPRLDPEPPAAEDLPAPAVRREPRPPVEPRRGNIALYADDELDKMARWLASDGLPLDRETRLVQMRHELGFTRRGNRIDERCGAALDRVRR